MTLRRILFRGTIRFLEGCNNLLPLREEIHLDCTPTEGKSIDLVTIAFNNAEIITYQIRFLQKNIEDRYHHIIADNSTDESESKRLQEFCDREGYSYVRLPKNLLNRIGSSYSHANAVNYVYRHIVRKRKPYAFGIIDHDLFPIKPVSILNDYLAQQPFFGPLRVRGGEQNWYLSGIMSFFRFDYVEQHGGIDFTPVTIEGHYLDTGGGNWYGMYRHIKHSDYTFPTEEVVPLREGGDRHGDSLEYFDGKKWLHTINGSGWKQVKEGKAELVEGIVVDLLI